ncbi:hypothetical protein BU24DRAFT_263405 [Aaosphaeria arxii CBS 175.79]|uniref:Uncharacterized protein n=1 Tax=Aaosphaeria arxii CBS 175.79 TaxID=1450172 RepID=A0A6A5XJZ1_9PLEO|nr:uncharacterized protein BU24DRAFT_263405 [Aaosphaeria arxii CBS 175.79]KAF2013060.1 hypothetical protein BU24DRAFT_263405 [Aaosphaeria arxii CBS 175.79]
MYLQYVPTRTLVAPCTECFVLIAHNSCKYLSPNVVCTRPPLLCSVWRCHAHHPAFVFRYMAPVLDQIDGGFPPSNIEFLFAGGRARQPKASSAAQPSLSAVRRDGWQGVPEHLFFPFLLTEPPLFFFFLTGPRKRSVCALSHNRLLFIHTSYDRVHGMQPYRDVVHTVETTVCTVTVTVT